MRKVISIRFSEKELENIDEIAKVLKMPRTKTIRFLINKNIEIIKISQNVLQFRQKVYK